MLVLVTLNVIFPYKYTYQLVVYVDESYRALSEPTPLDMEWDLPTAGSLLGTDTGGTNRCRWPSQRVARVLMCRASGAAWVRRTYDNKNSCHSALKE